VPLEARARFGLYLETGNQALVWEPKYRSSANLDWSAAAAPGPAPKQDHDNPDRVAAVRPPGPAKACWQPLGRLGRPSGQEETSCGGRVLAAGGGPCGRSLEHLVELHWSPPGGERQHDRTPPRPGGAAACARICGGERPLRSGDLQLDRADVAEHPLRPGEACQLGPIAARACGQPDTSGSEPHRGRIRAWVLSVGHEACGGWASESVTIGVHMWQVATAIEPPRNAMSGNSDVLFRQIWERGVAATAEYSEGVSTGEMRW
jgi:hypothetical protein